MRNLLSLKLLVVSFGLTLLLAGTVQAGTEETIYPDNPGESTDSDFQWENGCDPGSHIDCIDNDNDALHVYDEDYAIGSNGAESWDFVCAKTWASIDSLKFTIRTKNSDMFGEADCIKIVYQWWGGEDWLIYSIGNVDCHGNSSFDEEVVVRDTTNVGESWTQAMIEEDFEFGYLIAPDAQSSIDEFVSSFKITIYGTEEAEGNRRIHMIKKGAYLEQEDYHNPRLADVYVGR